MDQPLINQIVEAALLAASQPVSLAQLRELFPEDQPAPNGAIEAALEQLQADCAERGVELVEVASGFRYQVKAEVHGWVARLWTERQARYTRATLETLALIAYRQPITRGEIEQVRGVTVSSNIIKALEEREWIRVVGHRDVPGRPALFGTTKTFLDYFGLKRLDELPPLSELKDIGELEPQLQFDGATGVGPRIGIGGLEERGTGQPQASDDDHGADLSAAANDDAAGPGDADAADEGDGGVQAEDDARDLDFRSERPVVFQDDGDGDGDGDDADADTADSSLADPSAARQQPEASEATMDTEVPTDSDDADGGIDPEAAPGTRAATENDHEQDNAVETTTVPALTTASIDAAESERND